MQGLLEQKVEIASRHEELRQQADERRKKIIAARTAMSGMTPQEKMAYMQEHRQALFDVPEGMQDRRPRGAVRPPMQSWARQAPPRVAPPAARY
jgi:hypothetical protein